MIRLGVSDLKPTAWDGTVTLTDTAPTAAAIVDIEGWRFAGDTTDHRGSWKLSTHLAPGIPPTPRGHVAENGVIVYVRESSLSYQLQVKTVAGSFSFRGSDVPYGTVLTFLNGAATVRRVPGPLQFSASSVSATCMAQRIISSPK